MDLTLEVPDGHLFIRSVDQRGIGIGDQFHRSSLIISGSEVVSDWPVDVVDDIDEQSLQAVIDLEPELVLLGTGSRQIFLEPETQMIFFRRQIGFEVMTTDAACRTFNVLVAEGRKVVAALLPL